MPTNSMTYISATTRGRVFSSARSVANARPAVWVICNPAPTSKNANAPDVWPIQGDTCESADNKINAKGIIAKPPNCSMLPAHKNGTRRQPNTDRWVSDLNPIRALNGAAINGIATINDTSEAAIPSSTIMTRFSVPTSSTVARPTDT